MSAVKERLDPTDGLEELVESGDEDATKLQSYIKDGYFHESDVAGGMTSAPAFTFIIDGIDSITK